MSLLWYLISPGDRVPEQALRRDAHAVGRQHEKPGLGRGAINPIVIIISMVTSVRIAIDITSTSVITSRTDKR